MNINDINELRLILVSRSTDELETMNKLIVEILAVRTKITSSKKWCGCGDELRSEEDVKTKTCWICRSVGRNDKNKTDI